MLAKDIMIRNVVSISPAVSWASVTVVEVGPEHVVVEETGGLTQLRIPIYAVRVLRVRK